MSATFSKRPVPGFSPFKRPTRGLSAGVPLTGGNPSGFLLDDNNGKQWYVWFDTNGTLRFADATTVETAGFNFNTGGVVAGTISVNYINGGTPVAQDLWQAPSAAIVLSASEIHSVVGGASAALRPRKITDTSAPGAVAGATVKEITTAAFDGTAAINTKQNGTLSATASDYTFAAGDRLALNVSGTMTGYVGRVTINIALIG